MKVPANSAVALQSIYKLIYKYSFLEVKMDILYYPFVRNRKNPESIRVVISMKIR